VADFDARTAALARAALHAKYGRYAFIAAAVLSASIAYVLFHTPFEVGDTLNTLLRVDATSLTNIFRSDLLTTGFVRPMTVVTSKTIFETARTLHADPFLMYRAMHAACVTVILVGVVALLEITSLDTFAVGVIALAAVIGVAAFRQSIAETELNMKLIMATSCVCALLLTARRRRWWTDPAAVALAAYAMFANELGLLVAVILLAGFIVGFRNVSRVALSIVVALLASYIYLRFFRLDAGLPELVERSSGYGFSIRSPQELNAIFGTRRLPFYAYNIVSSASSVLFAEPSNGVFLLIQGLMTHKATSGMIAATIASTAATITILIYIVRRFRAWLTGNLTHDDRLLMVSLTLLAANAVISFPYLKDVTMVPATTLYAVALFVALKDLVGGVELQRIVPAVGVAVLVAALSVGWTLRGLSFYANMRVQAYKSQNDWVSLDDLISRGQIEMNGESQRGFVDRLRAQMIDMPVPKVYLDARWYQDLFENP
jgi:hypothetical protein